MTKRTVRGFVEEETKQNLQSMRHRIRKTLLAGEHTVTDLCQNFGLSKAQAEALLGEFRDAGANVVERAGRFSIDRYMAPDSEAALSVETSMASTPFRPSALSSSTA